MSKHHRLKTYFISAGVSFLIITGIISATVGIVFYGPYTELRDLWITSAMTSMSHQYLATLFFTGDTIREVMETNTTDEPEGSTDTNLIDTNTSSNIVRVENASRNGFKAYMLVVSNPAMVSIAVTDRLYTRGQKVLDIVKQNDALAGINAGGFVDTNGKGTGGTPTGIVVSHGKIVYEDGKKKYAIIGFDEENRLILGNYSINEIKKLKIRDAVEFSPFLIVNGKSAITKGNGGWGIAPRTSIGQTADGTVLMLVIDGRQVSSAGATLKDVIGIMQEYGAVNASNLDGGSSTTLIYNGAIVNSPSSIYGPRSVVTAFVVKTVK